jgi:hypothetical protein
MRGPVEKSEFLDLLVVEVSVEKSGFCEDLDVPGYINVISLGLDRISNEGEPKSPIKNPALAFLPVMCATNPGSLKRCREPAREEVGLFKLLTRR